MTEQNVQPSNQSTHPKVRKAVIPVAGLGTRFLPATKAMPKEMLPVVDKPAIQYVVEECTEAGINDILMITGRSKRALEDHFDRVPDIEKALEAKGDDTKLQKVQMSSDLADIHYVRQGDPKGLGHAVLRAEKHIGDEPFAVLLGDDLIDFRDEILQAMIEVQEKTGGSVVGLMEVPPEEISAYGVAEVAETNPATDCSVDHVNISGLVEKPEKDQAPSNLAVIGRYVLTPEIFSILSTLAPGRGGEIQLTDALEIQAKEGNVYGVIFSGRRYDTGDKLSYIKAVVQLATATEELGEPLNQWLKEFVQESKEEN